MAVLIDAKPAHARLSPSSADRWMRCAGSVAAEALEPNDENIWSAEGTVAHKVFEMCLTYGFEVSDFLGRVFKQGEFFITCDDAMVEFLQPIIDEILDTPGRHFYENRVKLDRWLPDQFGTLDVGILQIKRGWIIIRDLKYGKGLPVRAERNYQLMIYAGGFWDDYAKKYWPEDAPDPKFKIIIDQPRNEGGGGEFEISYDDLMTFMKEVKKKGALTYDEDAPRTPGDKQCGYCKAAQNGHCRDYDKWNVAKWGAKFTDYQRGIMRNPPKPEKMDPETRALILDQAPALRQWLNRLHADHINDCLANGVVGGKKAVVGRKGNRQWKDKKAAEDWLDRTLPEHVDLYKPREIISPATAQKYLGKGGKEKLKPHVEQSDGKPVLVPADDPREAIEAYQERFTEFDEEEG